MNIRRTAAALTSAAALSVTGVAMATPASAAPVVTGGLVNVTIANIDVETGDILSENTVQVGVAAALAIAANICDTNVNVLAVQFRDGAATCESATGDQTVTLRQGSRR